MAHLNDFTNPMAQMFLNQQRKTEYHKKLADYDKRKQNLTHKQIDTLILQIASGKNTYKDIQDALPEINSPTMIYYLVDTPKENPNLPFTLSSIELLNHNLSLEPRNNYYFQLATIPDDFYPLYEFKPTDKFILSISGENVLYKLQKEQESLALNKQSVASASAAVFWAKISIVVSIIFFLIGKLSG
jgi:hypothetical protein